MEVIYSLLVAMFLAHFIADFLLQSREVAKNKSSNFKYLLKHLTVHLIVFNLMLFPVAYFFTSMAYFSFMFAYKIAVCNAILHGIVDWYIWRLYKWYVLKRESKQGMKALTPELVASIQKDFKFWEDKAFYDTIGLDQFMHIMGMMASLALVMLGAV